VITGSLLSVIPLVLSEVTALLVHNEAVLPMLLEILRARGRRVPEDISVLAVCPREVAVSLPIPLTAIEVPATEIGQIAVEMLIAQLRGNPHAQTRLLAPVSAVISARQWSSGARAPTAA
jgi:DNA-binding LacI/PurR family transcriptional regulator